MHKLFLTMAIAMLFLVVALFPLVNRTSAKADVNASDASKYFTGIEKEDLSFVKEEITGEYYLQAQVKSDSVSSESVKDENVLAIKNLLVVNDFGMGLKTQGLDTLTIVFNNEAFYANGNPFVVDAAASKLVYEVKKEIINELKIDLVNKTISFNGGSAVDFVPVGDENLGYTLEVSTKVVDNHLVANVNGTEIVASDVKAGGEVIEYRSIKSVDGKAMAQIKFMFKLNSAFNSETPASFKIANVNQKQSEGATSKYNQTFEFDDNGVLTDKNVYPRVAVDESFYKRDVNGVYTIKKDVMRKYTLTFKTFAVLDDVTTSDVYLDADGDANVWVDPSVSNPKAIRFSSEKSYSVSICGKSDSVYETLSVEIVNFENDNSVPYYDGSDEGAKLSIETALKNSYYNQEEGHYVALGDSIDLPSFKDVVFDDCYGYESLIKTTYYASESKEQTSMSGLSFNLDTAGKYYFFVTFADGKENSMVKEAFDSEIVNKTGYTGTNYTAWVYNFEVSDDAPIDVEKPISQGKGYKGVGYVASEFTINAEGCKTTYKLYYNAKENALADDEGWIEIPNATKTTDKNFNDGNYTYDEVQKIAFKGALEFTPDKAGTYKIECSVTSLVTSRFDTEVTLINVSDDITTVKNYDTKWVENNIWTIVFLGIGGLCLIAIVVLLFIKPKDSLAD